jgi:putative ABC transport system substrate-binding protein
MMTAGMMGARSLHAQQAAVPVVGWLCSGLPDAWAVYVAAFRQGLGDAGYVDIR